LLSLCAQSQDSSNSTNGSWNATTQPQFSGSANPTRTTEFHSQSDGRAVDRQSLQRMGSDGRYEPYSDTEKETTRVDANTVRTVERTYGRDADGRRMLLQVAQEETHKRPDGEVSVVRTTSNPDPDGKLQVARRDVQDTKQLSPSVQETKTTVFLPGSNGGLAPSMQIEERQTQNSDHETAFRRSTQTSDGNGRWQVSEVREGTIQEDGKNRTTQENVLRPDTDGRLSLAERTVRKEAETSSGDKSDTQEKYSAEIPGAAGDGGLHLQQRITTHRSKSENSQSSSTQVQQPNPGDPGIGLRVTQQTIDVVRPGPGGTSKTTQTIQTLDPNGSFGVVSVDTRTQDNSAIKVDIAPPKPR